MGTKALYSATNGRTQASNDEDASQISLDEQVTNYTVNVGGEQRVDSLPVREPRKGKGKATSSGFEENYLPYYPTTSPRSPKDMGTEWTREHEWTEAGKEAPRAEDEVDARGGWEYEQNAKESEEVTEGYYEPVAGVPYFKRY